MLPEGTHSLLSVCYSAFRDRLTQTETSTSLFADFLVTSALPPCCEGWLLYSPPPRSQQPFFRLFAFLPGPVPACHPVHSPVQSATFAAFFSLERVRSEPISLPSGRCLSSAGGSNYSVESFESTTFFFGCFLRPTPFEIRRSRLRPPPRSCTLPSRPFRRRPLPSASGGQ
jgi:hypothetical protein